MECLAADALAAVEAYDAIQPQVWISRHAPDEVLTEARAIDARLADGEDLPLAGATFAVKDNIDVAGLATTAACPAFAYRPQVSATVVSRLQAAGALVIGKTNLDQFATGLVGTRSPHGAPACVFNREYVSGGSSSGSAVAVAAGLVDFALGTDTAGSGRIPAAFNGCIGFKPSKGRWSTFGLVPACRSLDCISVFTADCADAGLIDRIVAGADAQDPYSRPDRAATAFGSRFTIGVPPPSQLEFFGDQQSARLYTEALDRLEVIGGRRVEVDIAPLLAAAELLYAGPWVAERTAAMEPMLRKNPGAIHPVVRAIAQAGAGISGVEAFRGLYRLQALALEAAQIWARVDTLALPTAPTIYRISELLAEPVTLNANLGRYTNFVNLLDMCAIALPGGYRDNGTGFGVSLIAEAFADAALLGLGARYEQALPPERPAIDLHPRTTRVKLGVVGAHLSGMPLNWQLTSREARLSASTWTAPCYHLYAMAGGSPAKPALVHSGETGAIIEIEIYEMSLEAFGSFVSAVPAPLAIGTVQLIDGSEVNGFVAEPRALVGAKDITDFGGWRAYCASLSAATP